MYELMPLYVSAITPALLPKKGPLLVTELSTAFNRILAGAVTGVLLKPSAKPQAPPMLSAARYVTPVP